MVKRNLKEREVIGEIQLIFGIILLVSGIIGIILDYNSYNTSQNGIIIGLLCVLVVILSLLFITQGLLNSSEKNR